MFLRKTGVHFFAHCSIGSTWTGDPFVGPDVSLDRPSDFIVKLSLDTSLYFRESIVISRG
jgi:hypothetical protein